MTTSDRPQFVLVVDDRILWHLASGTRIRGNADRGRTFIADSRTPGRVWHGAHLCHIQAVEIPAEVTRG